MSEVYAQEPRERITVWSQRSFVIFLTVYIAVMTVLRGSFDVRYNDTTNLSTYLTDSSQESSTPEIGRDIWLRTGNGSGVTGENRPDSYRPLQYHYGRMAAWLYFHVGPLPEYALCFLLLGLSGYLIFRLFLEVGSIRLAWICAAAYLFFPAVVSPAWNPLAGPQSIIPGAFAGGLWAYLLYCRTRRFRYLIVVALLCVVGPLYKETIGVLPFLLLAHHLFLEKTRSMGVLAGLAAGCFHGIFPAAALTFGVTGEIHLVTIFHCGALHDHAVAQTWRPNYLLDLTAFIPPSLLLVSLLSIAIRGCMHAPTLQLALPSRLATVGIVFARATATALAITALLALSALMLNRPILRPHYASLLAFLAIGLHGLLYVDALIAGWFFSMFLPLLRIYFNTTQCGYVAAPLIYLCAAPLAPYCLALSAQDALWRVRAGLRYGLLAIGIVAFCDNALSVPNSWIAYRRTGKFNKNLLPPELIETLRQPDAAKQWTYLDNTVVIDDAAILSTKFQLGRAFYNFNYGVPPAKVVKSIVQLNGVLAQYNCLLIFADYFNPHRYNFWDITSIRPHFLNVSERELHFDAFYADPLRFFVDNRYRSMMAPPDFQDEFVRETSWMRERFSNHFHLCIRGKGPIQ